MNSIGAKLFEAFKFKNLKSDAKPQPPRPTADKIKIEDITDEDFGNYENLNNSNDQEDIFSESNDNKKKSKTKKNKNKIEFEDDEFPSAPTHNSVNVQATGNVWNIVGSNNVKVGNTYHINNIPSSQGSHNAKFQESNIKKCSLIEDVMQAKQKIDFEYMDYICKNLGANWQNFFRKIGYSQGRIETFLIDEGHNGVSEVRYKLLLDWVRNDKDGSLGKITTVLWKENEKEIVKELALLYNKNQELKK